MAVPHFMAWSPLVAAGVTLMIMALLHGMNTQTLAKLRRECVPSNGGMVEGESNLLFANKLLRLGLRIVGPGAILWMLGVFFWYRGLPW